MKYYSDNALLSPRVVVSEAGLDSALRLLKTVSAATAGELRRHRYFTGPSEQRRHKHLRALQRRHRAKH